MAEPFKNLLNAALAPPLQAEDLGAMRITKPGLAGWILWRVGEWVARCGMATPQRALQCLHANANVERRALLRHASRTLIKQSHPEALRAWGLGAALKADARLRMAPQRVTLGDSLELEVSWVSRSGQPQTLVVLVNGQAVAEAAFLLRLPVAN